MGDFKYCVWERKYGDAMDALRKEFLELLEKDKEFRYAVAGYLGVLEVLKRLDQIADAQKKLIEGQNKIWAEISKIWDEISKIWREIEKVWKEIESVRGEIKALREEVSKIWEEIRSIWSEVKKLREDFNKMLAEIRSINMRLERVEGTLEKITLSIEDDARVIIEWSLRGRGIDMRVRELILPDLQMNIYGASDEICIVGEVETRAGVSTLRELERKFEILRSKYPEYLRRRVILVIYTLQPTYELIEEARKKGVWLLRPTVEYVRPDPLWKEISL